MISSEDLVYALTVTLTLKTATPFHFIIIFKLHDTPACDDLSPYHVWLQKVEQFGRIRPNEILKVHCDLGCDVTTAVQYFYYFGFKRIISSKDIVKFRLYEPSP